MSQDLVIQKQYKTPPQELSEECSRHKQQKDNLFIKNKRPKQINTTIRQIQKTNGNQWANINPSEGYFVLLLHKMITFDLAKTAYSS